MYKLKMNLEKLSEKYKEQIDSCEKIFGKKLSPYQKQLFLMMINLPPNLPPGAKIIIGRGGRLAVGWPENMKHDTFERAGFNKTECEELQKMCERYDIEPDRVVTFLKGTNVQQMYIDDLSKEENGGVHKGG